MCLSHNFSSQHVERVGFSNQVADSVLVVVPFNHNMSVGVNVIKNLLERYTVGQQQTQERGNNSYHGGDVRATDPRLNGDALWIAGGPRRQPGCQRGLQITKLDSEPLLP